MTRSVLFALGLFLIVISLYVVRHPTGDLASFMNTTPQWARIRIGFGIGFITYSLVSHIWQFAIRIVLGVSAAAALLFAALSLVALYILAIDTFCLLAGGIFALLGSLELQTAHPLHIQLPNITFPKLALPKINLHLPETETNHTLKSAVSAK